MGEDEKDRTRVNPSEGRVPVSWNECADWLEFGQVVWSVPDQKPTTVPAAGFRSEGNLDHCPHLTDYRLLPPPGLVAAPESMDGGGWLGQGKDVPDGWPWRSFTDGPYSEWAAKDERPPAGSEVVQCRPPAPKREPEWVPLTKLVGRTVWGETKPVFRTDAPAPPSLPDWRWRPEADLLWRPFPDGTLDLDTGRVKVEPEGEQ